MHCFRLLPQGANIIWTSMAYFGRAEEHTSVCVDQRYRLLLCSGHNRQMQQGLASNLEIHQRLIISTRTILSYCSCTSVAHRPKYGNMFLTCKEIIEPNDV